MKAVKCPTEELSYTNCAIINVNDFSPDVKFVYFETFYLEFNIIIFEHFRFNHRFKNYIRFALLNYYQVPHYLKYFLNKKKHFFIFYFSINFLNNV